jgi:hypothetical protein
MDLVNYADIAYDLAEKLFVRRNPFTSSRSPQDRWY